MVSITEAERIRAERLSESRTRAAETRKRRSEAAAAAGAALGGGGADWTLANDIMGPIIYNTMYGIIGLSQQHLGMLLDELGRRWTAYQKVQGSSLCTPLKMYGVLPFFLSKSYFLYGL
jgi:hypothetical protein